MQEQKRPILSIKRKPSLMYQKPPQKPESEQNAAQPEQGATVATKKAKPKYKAPPEWKDVKHRVAADYFRFIAKAGILPGDSK